MKDAISVERLGAVASIEVPNVAAARALLDACERLRDDTAIRAIILSCARWDTPFNGDAPGDPFGFLADVPQPVIAPLSGQVAGAGLALALAADIRIAANDARFTVPDLHSGRLPAGGVIARLTRLIGPGNATHMLLTGEPLPANDALRLGLVSEVLPAKHLLDRAHEIAGRIAERGPLAVRYAKEAARRGLDMPLEQALRYETDLTIILQTTEDRAEGVRAFLEKREPKFKGK